MKFFLQAILIGISALNVAQAQFQNLPDCAKPCAANLPSQCNLDVQCICSDSSWISGISCCISTKCSPSDQQKTLNVAVQLCDTVKVTLPSAASCPASASATAGASSAIAGPINVASSAASNAYVAATSGVSGAQTASLSSASGASIGTTTSATGPSSTSTTSTSSSATQASGAAQSLGTNMGAVGAAVAALAFL